MKVATIASVIGAVGVTTATGDSPTSAVGTSPGYIFTGTGTPATTTTTTSSAATTSTGTPQYQEFNSNDPDVMVHYQCVFKTGHYYCDDSAENEAQVLQEAVEFEAEVRAAIAEASSDEPAKTSINASPAGPTGDAPDSDGEHYRPAHNNDESADHGDSDDESYHPTHEDSDSDDDWNFYHRYGRYSFGRHGSPDGHNSGNGGIAYFDERVPELRVYGDCTVLGSRYECRQMPIKEFVEWFNNRHKVDDEEKKLRELINSLPDVRLLDAMFGYTGRSADDMTEDPVPTDVAMPESQDQDDVAVPGSQSQNDCDMPDADRESNDESLNTCVIDKHDPTSTSISAPLPTEPTSDLEFEFNTADPTVRMHNSCFFSDGQFHCIDTDELEGLQECALNQGAASEGNVHFITGCESFFSDYDQCVLLSENDWACQTFSWEQLMQLEDQDIDDDEEMEMQMFEVIMENLASTINNLDVEDSDESPIASTHVTQGGAIETVAASIPDSEIKDTIRYLQVQPDSPYKLHQACILKNGAFYCTDEVMDAEDLYNSLSELKQANSDLTNVHVPIPTEFVNAHMNMPLEELDALTGDIFRHQTCIILADDWVCATKDQTGDASGTDVANELPPVPIPTFTTSILPSGVAAPTGNSGLVARDPNSGKHSAAASGTGVYHASGTGAIHPSGTGAAYPSGSGVGSIDLPTSGAKQFGISLAGLLVAVLAL